MKNSKIKSNKQVYIFMLLSIAFIIGLFCTAIIESNEKPKHISNYVASTIKKGVKKPDYKKVPLPKKVVKKIKNKSKPLYLKATAAKEIKNIDNFERVLRKYAEDLKIEADWIMAVMHSESKFIKSVGNYQGSGATGLIQFMPKTAKELKTTTRKLAKMTAIEQLFYVHKYFENVQRSRGKIKTLTDCYLAVLWQSAVNKDQFYTLYTKAKRPKTYALNSGLDKYPLRKPDGKIQKIDIYWHLKGKYPFAFETKYSY